MNLPLHRCSNCGRLVAGRCPHCERRRDLARPNAAARGYCSATWKRFRAVVLARSPLCRICQAAGRVTLANEVDHIRPVSGPDDATFFRFDSVQALCGECHRRKTAVEDSAFARRT